jgi:hypothetical protein
VTAAAVLRRLHDEGVEVLFDPPDNIRLRGPLTFDLVELAREAKPDLLALVRPTVQATSCSCCGRFYFAEPSRVCFWCQTRTSIDKSDKSPAEGVESGTSVNSVNVYPEPRTKRECPGCGGGMQPTDPDGAECFSCRHVAGGGAT